MESSKKKINISELDLEKLEMVTGGKINTTLEAFIMMTPEEKEGYNKIYEQYKAAEAAWKADPTPEKCQRMKDIGNEGIKFLELVKTTINETGRCW